MTNALVPASGLIPASSPVRRHAVSIDLYPGRFQDEGLYSVYVLNESEEEYGPDGRRMVKANYAEFVDVYA